MEGPVSAGPSRVRRIAAVAVAGATATALLGGCAVGGRGGDDADEAAGGGLPEKLSAAPQPLQEPGGAIGASGTTGAGSGGPATTPTAAGAPGTTSSTAWGGGAGGAEGGGNGTTTSTTLRPFREVAVVNDRTGDAGLQARPYGDLVLLRLDDDGSRARVVVRMAGDLPAQPAEGEVISIGVDFVVRGDEHQLFALGNADGWRAGLHQGGTWIDFPGTFELGGNTIAFTVPWSSLGGRRAGSFSVFADWSQARAVLVADASEDRAPDRGALGYSP